MNVRNIITFNCANEYFESMSLSLYFNQINVINIVGISSTLGNPKPTTLAYEYCEKAQRGHSLIPTPSIQCTLLCLHTCSAIHPSNTMQWKTSELEEEWAKKQQLKNWQFRIRALLLSSLPSFIHIIIIH